MADNVWSKVVDGVFDVVDQFVEDKDAKQKAKHQLDVLRIQAERDALKGQLDANIESAKHPSIFVAGARPAVMWFFLFLLAYNYIGYNLLIFIAGFFPEFDISSFPRPIDDTTELFYVLGGMLGLSGMRSWEKGKGVARNSLQAEPQFPPIVGRD